MSVIAELSRLIPGAEVTAVQVPSEGGKITAGARVKLGKRECVVTWIVTSDMLDQGDRGPALLARSLARKAQEALK